ncbi:PssD/Cps14F family polysaccharide biosynthesis glycosyltransferase [Planomonospora sp. ID82291]|uniref:PssD/Cps14F family polysaccharide biosynthesis glycosyltransferase n=1 Tax=Planomonospora sp. ID82291 TaxID=2738136 RepID=UPI0018C3E394|nr:PssD/Cps14F family polysaccharide biosynthesis glycosyltransferase [Planomonospora sp. ID82291]MBG0813890.1 UDP-N-acetylglucosamine--LPS N-acetylglucosamine transferase [Planomonospora sp. ID82291]
MFYSYLNEHQPHGVERAKVTAARSVLLVASSGGHLAQLDALEPWWREWDRTWVTFRTDDASSRLSGEQIVWGHHPTTRNVPNLLRNFVLAWRMLRRKRPDLIVSTGAALAFPFFVLAKILRIPTVYIEVYDRLDSPTLTGRLCVPFTTLFLVQWEEQRRFYPGATVIGGLL